MALDAAALITQVAAQRGYSPSQIKGILANAKAESGLNPNAVGDHGHSIGLFQLNDAGGLGAGMSVAARKDPLINVNKILDAAAGAGLTPGKAPQEAGAFAAAFVQKVERPANAIGEMVKRAAIARGAGAGVASGASAAWGQVSPTGTYTPANYTSTPLPGTGNFTMPSIQPIDIAGILQQAVGTVKNAQPQATPDYQPYLQSLQSQRSADLKAELSSLDAMVAQATNRLRDQYASGSGALQTIGQGAATSFGGVASQLGAPSGDPVHDQMLASLNKLGVDPSAYQATASADAAGMAGTQQAAQGYVQGLAGSTSGVLGGLSQQLLQATHDQALGDVGAAGLKAHYQAQLQSDQSGQQLAGEFAKTKYAGDVQAQQNLVPQILQAAGMIGQLAQGNQNNQIQAAQLQGQLAQYAAQNGLDLAKIIQSDRQFGATQQQQASQFGVTSAQQQQQIGIQQQQQTTDAAYKQVEGAASTQNALANLTSAGAAVTKANHPPLTTAQQKISDYTKTVDAYNKSILSQVATKAKGWGVTDKTGKRVNPLTISQGKIDPHELDFFIPIVAADPSVSDGAFKGWLRSYVKKNAKFYGASQGTQKEKTDATNRAITDAVTKYNNFIGNNPQLDKSQLTTVR